MPMLRIKSVENNILMRIHINRYYIIIILLTYIHIIYIHAYITSHINQDESES